jgi:UTP:GlnB (protein PII) uridylyltransferase
MMGTGARSTWRFVDAVGRIDGMGEERACVPRVPDSVQEPFRSALVAAVDAWVVDLRERLVSLVLFGSVARGRACPTSDIDLLLVAEGLPRSLADRYPGDSKARVA